MSSDGSLVYYGCAGLGAQFLGHHGDLAGVVPSAEGALRGGLADLDSLVCRKATRTARTTWSQRTLSTKIESNGKITSGGHHETGVESAKDFLECIGAPQRFHEKILPLVREHMCHTVQRRLGQRQRRRPAAAALGTLRGGPTLKEGSRSLYGRVLRRTHAADYEQCKQRHTSPSRQQDRRTVRR